MARKKKVVNKKEDMLNELADKLKASNKKPESGELDLLFNNFKNSKASEESELEEDVGDSTLDFKNLEFHQFMELSKDSETRAPVLERIAGSVPRPIFVGGVPQRSTGTENNEVKDEFKYVPGAADALEPKYIPTAEVVGNPMERIDTETLGRRNEYIPRIDQGAFFDRVSMAPGFNQNSQTQERIERVGRFDTERAGRRDPFEKEGSERYKPKLPKG